MTTHEQKLEVDHSPGAAVARAVESGQRMLLDRLELVRLELQETLRSTIKATMLAAIGGVVLALGWVVLMAALVILLNRWLPLSACLAIVGGAHLVAGAVALFFSRTAPHQPELSVKPQERASTETRIPPSPAGLQTAPT